MHTPKNFMEDIVYGKVEKALRDIGACTCNRCQADAAAIALNNLPPKYVAARDTYAKLNTLENQFIVDILTQVTFAAEQVAKNPRHDEE